MALTDTAIPSTVTTVGRGKILASGMNEAAVAEIVFGSGRNATPATATGVTTPLVPPVSLAPSAFRQTEDVIQATVQQGRTATVYMATEMAILDSTGDCLVYVAAAAGETLFTKSEQPAVWTFIGQLLNLPAGGTLTFTVDVGYFVADENTHGTVVLAGDADADADEANASDTKVPTMAQLWRWFTGARIVSRLSSLTGGGRLSYNSLKDKPAIPNLNNLNADNLASGTVPPDRIPRLAVSKVRIYSGTDDVATQNVVGTLDNPAQAGDIYAQREA